MKYRTEVGKLGEQNFVQAEDSKLQTYKKETE
jgi:hypothetical protein